MRKPKIDTKWELWGYDVWGNSRDGYEVNDRSCYDREYPLQLTVETYNQGTSQEFKVAYPTDAQIRKVFGLRKFNLELDGDDMTIYINRARDGYPIGEMHCISHKSLAPIKEL